MAELYKRLVRLDTTMNTMVLELKSETGNAEQDAKSENERIAKAGFAFHSFTDYYSENQMIMENDIL